MIEYLPVLIYLGVALALAGVMLLIPWLLNPFRATPAKTQAYESGFEAFDTARHVFDVRFYLVAILFIVFDLEVAYLFPWAMVIQTISWYGFISMMVFLFILAIGFVYEWKKGALEWE